MVGKVTLVALVLTVKFNESALCDMFASLSGDTKVMIS